ncbi:Lrp/AsnC family transcriptional regulator [Pseudoruegeria sp. SK021]|uniref:Lrp/AsnC family transcriptional regulator n=1 Tax=Pseudoruegeria sp. SK021 TaxID=1933035 RepID=UPI000A262830|nr:Lrp/AsnC family transcriptional regulator [Pseudoruegeria sp. SK021]OSP56837.1 AsnC family transcriptional regulator [Pseudoruegeria sp. SK021]
MELDKRDLQILQILSVEGRISKSELARRVNLSSSPCWERLKRLENSGLIKGYRAEVDLTQATELLTVFVQVELESHLAAAFQLFERSMAQYDEIIACWATGGGYDYLLQVMTTNIGAYQILIDDLLDARIGIKRYFTYVVTKQVKSGAPPLASLLGARVE